MIRFFLSAAIVLCFIQANAQNGWDYIKQNDNILARQTFLELLKTDSLNTEALQGMIYLCNVDKDNYDLEKYTRQLVKKVNDPHYFYLFDGKNHYTNKEIEALDIPFRYKINSILSNADDNFRDRKFNEGISTYQKTISNLKWSYMGPFKNMNGYGYEIETPVEKKNFEFSTDQKYINHNNIELKWVSPAITNPYGYIDHETHCMNESEGVYYANSFFELPADQKVFLRLARQYPIKIWIDDHLIFTGKEKINFSWDAENIELNFKKGWHRILIKYCVGSFFTGKNGGYEWAEDLNYSSYSEEEYSSGENYLDDFYRSYGRFGAYSTSGQICIRLTNQNSELIPTLNSTNEKQNYSKEPYQPMLVDKEELSYFKKQIEANPNNWFNYYLYYMTAIKSGYTKEVEEFAYRTWQKNQDKVFFKFLTNKIFEENGKKEKADKIISGIDMQKSPVYKLLNDELMQIDQENEPDVYLAKVNEIRTICPSNLGMIRRLLEQYDKQGLTAERKNTAKELMKQYPRYKYTLEEYLEDDNKPTDYDIGNRTDYNSKTAEKRAAKDIKKYFNEYDYSTLIKKYKGLNKPASALALYDEMLKIQPDNFEMRREKAEYLFNLNRQEEALKELDIVLASQPYNSEVYELMGDIFKDQGNNAKALEQYKIAKQFGGGGNDYSLFGFSGGDNGEIDEKIDKLQGQKLLKSKFNSRSLDDIIADQSNLEKYNYDESVILGYVYDVILEKDGTTNLFTKMAIKILTDAGAKNWTEYDFSFLGNLTTCKVLKANGSEFNPDKSGGFVVFKNLEPGDIIKLEGSFKWNSESELGKALIQFNYLNFDVPMRYAKYEYAMPEGIKLNYLVHNVPDQLQKRDADGFTFYKWEYTDMKKVAQEEAVVDQVDTYNSLMVSTIPDWSTVVDWYKAKSYRKLESNYELEAVRDSIIKPNMSDEEKVIAIYNYITKEIKYSYTRLLQSNYIPKNTDLTISSRIGDCKDVASLMIALLQLVDIESYYCLVKTNQFFHLKTLPSLYFDHVIAAYKLNGEMKYVDLTTDYYPYYVLNENDINAWGLLIKDGETEIFQLPADQLNPKKNLTVHEVKATLNKDKSVDITVNSTFNGLNGGLLRELNALKSRDNFEQEVLYYLGDGQYDNISLEKFEFDNMNEITAPLNGRFNFRAMNFSDNIVDIYFTRVPLMQGMKTSTIFSSNKRYNTLDLSQIFRVTPSLQKINLDFPKGTTVRKMPSNVSIDNEFVKYSLTFTKTASGIYVERYQEFKTNEVKPEDFKKFRELYLKLLDHDRTKIGLVVNG